MVSSRPSALLTDPGIRKTFAGSVSIDGDTLVATMGGESGVEDVFTTPAGGWLGDVIPVARLVDGQGRFMSSGVIDGDTIATFSSARHVVYIFTEPAGRWAGTITPSAQLRLPRRSNPSTELAISQSTVFVPGPNRTYVFQEPATGWSGELAPSATLNKSGDVSASGSTALVNGFLYSEPATGWAGVLTPNAALVPRPRDLLGGLPATELLAGPYAVSATPKGRDLGCPPPKRCPVRFHVATEPAPGWAGPRLAQSFAHGASTNDRMALAIAGRSLYQTDGQRVAVISLPATAGVQITPPAAESGHASGFTGPAPALRLALAVSASQPSIGRLIVGLPSGLRFDARRLAPGVTLQGTAIHRSALGNRHVVLTPAATGAALDDTSRAHVLRISIGRGALEPTPGLARRLRSSGHNHPVLRIHVRAQTRFAVFGVVFRVRV
jgi:hypothetical protein